MIVADNGGHHDDQGASNYPLRGQKNTFSEGGIRTVGLVSGPVLSPSSKLTKELMHITDWYPTLVSLAGGTTEDQGLDGYDLWYTLK